MLRVLIGITALLFLCSCGASKSKRAAGILKRSWTENQPSPSAKAYCSTPIIYTDSITVSGTASFEFRNVVTTAGSEGLSDISKTPKPIRHAQFEVTDSSNNIIQCGETTNDGSFSFKTPKTNRAYTLKVYSRSLNEFNKASVFKAPETNELYNLEVSFTSSHDQSFQLKALASGDVLAGAFNILDQIHLAWDRMKVLASGLSATDTIQITEIPSVDIYWEKGFDPGLYLNATNASFFSRPQKKLFILGGRNGDVNFSDTDHFDSSIILHEYFHFLENSISNTDTPGGSHNGNQLLDPRLAWSEGAAQFFQAAILDTPAVIDTYGTPDGVTGFTLVYSIEDGTNDTPSVLGEAEYREFSIARLLWDMHDSETGETASETQFDNLENKFPDFWAAFANRPPSQGGTSTGFNSNSALFRSLGLLLSSINNNSPTAIHTNTLWTNLFDKEKVFYSGGDFRFGYAKPINLTPDSPTISFATSGAVINNEISDAHPNLELRIFSTTISGGPRNFGIKNGVVTSVGGSGGAIEVQVFEEHHKSFQNPIAKLSGTKTVSLPQGNYLIVVLLKSSPGPPVTALNFQLSATP